jgi:holliday junction DNA helicase RuvA
MIDLLQGIIKAINPPYVSLLVNNIGYAIAVPETKHFVIEQQITFYIHHHWNQENGPMLYGFEKHLDKQVFQLIISGPGIGPKIGLAILSKMPASTFISAIATGDAKALSSIHGIGTKKAEGIILHLKNKIEKLVIEKPEIIANNTTTRQLTELSQTLAALHYSRPEVAAALEHIRNSEEYQSLAFDGILRKALIYLSKRM